MEPSESCRSQFWGATPWSVIFQAQQSPGEVAQAARRNLLQRYHRAVHRYLEAKTRDSQVADHLASDFAVRVLEGHPFLKRAVPDAGEGPGPRRFRYYLQHVLFWMIKDYYRQQARPRPLPLPADDREPAAGPPDPLDAAEDDPEFKRCWRQEMLNLAWEGLENVERQTGRPYCTIFLFRQEHPELRSGEIAQQLGDRLGHRFTAESIRQLLRRGRLLFGHLLIEEVARSLKAFPEEEVSPQALEQELIDLGLLFSYCKSALETSFGHARAKSR
jgi:RNA polymerase sigma-70 factor (ECF subfamily)